MDSRGGIQASLERDINEMMMNSGGMGDGKGGLGPMAWGITAAVVAMVVAVMLVRFLKKSGLIATVVGVGAAVVVGSGVYVYRSKTCTSCLL